MSAVTDLLKVPKRPIKQKIRLKSGRKSTYSEQAVEKFCQGIASGQSLADVCQQDGTPSVAQAFEWMRKYPSFAERYARACEERGMWFGHKLTDLAAAVLAGEVDPQAARVAGDFYKFTAARLASKTWGEKSQVTVEHSVSAQAAQVLQELAQRGKQRQIEAQCIDVTPYEGTASATQVTDIAASSHQISGGIPTYIPTGGACLDAVPSLDEGADTLQDQALAQDCTDLAPIGAVDEAGPRPPGGGASPAPAAAAASPAPRKSPRK